MGNRVELTAEQLAELLGGAKEKLLEDWCRRVLDDGDVPRASELSRPELRDDVPGFLDALIERLRHASADARRAWVRVRGAALHGHSESRSREQYTIEAALREWSHLREAILDVCAESGVAMTGPGARVVHAEIDEAMARVAIDLHRVQSEAAHQRTAELEAVLASLPEAVFIGDDKGVRLANPRALEYVDGVEGEDVATAVHATPQRVEVMDPDTRAPIAFDALGWMEATRGERLDRDVLVRSRATGRERILRYAVGPIVRRGAVIGVVALAGDVTERRRSASRLAAEAELRDRFAAILGHDLRTPLTAILGTASMLLRRVDPSTHEARSLRRIVEASLRMTRMIAQLMDFARARFGAMPIEVGPCDLAEVCNAMVEEMRAVDPSRPYEVQIEGDPNGVWDHDRLSQVLTNLLGNAHQHATRDTPIVVRIVGSDDRVRCSVTNRGVPIPPDQLGVIFEPFRSWSSTGRKGLGLGLYIVSRIVDAHGGTVGASSDERGETTFTVDLPRGPAPPSTGHRAQT